MGAKRDLVNVLKLVSKKGVFEVLDYLNSVREARFRDINNKTKLPCQATLCQALQRLHKLAFINRKTIDIPGESPITFYFIEKKGEDLLRLIVEMKEFE